jgi:microcystin-dependent protein
MARQPFNTRWAQGVETEDSLNSFKAPGDVRLSTGWEGGQDKDAPPAGQENWWHNRVDSALQDLERRGAMSWHSQAVYASGAPCLASDGNYYESITNGNAGNSPLSSQANWRLIGSSLYSSFSVGEYKDVSHDGLPDSGWIKSNGAVLIRAAYPRLFAKIGTTYNTGGELSTQFRIPDWRGVFPRCLDEGRGIDSGRGLGNTLQASQNLAHAHGATASSAGEHAHTSSFPREKILAEFQPGVGGNAVLGDQQSDGIATVTTTSGGSHTHTVSIGSNGGAEARSINLAQVRWIRYL